MNEWNFVHKDISPEDKEMILGPFEKTDGPFIEIENETLADIVVEHIKKFSSKTQARKNGWDGPIPPGYKEHKLGKHIRFYTLKPVE